MLQNAYFLAKIGADTAENEQDFAEILPIAVLGESLSELGGDVCTICLDPSMIACADR